jgi:PAS domain S-box-containing protein
MTDGGQTAVQQADADESSRLSAMLNGIWSGFYALDRDWRFTFFNDFCQDYFGQPREEVLGRTLWELFPQLSASEIGDRFRAAMDRRERVEFEARSVVRPDREVRWRLFPTPEGLGVTIEDVTERRRAERQMRESEERLRALADNLPSGMVYQMQTSPDGAERRFVYISEGCERLNGVSAEAALADPIALYSLVLPEHVEALGRAEAEAIATLTPMDVEAPFRRPTGEVFWSRIISAPRQAADGQLLWDGLQIDVSERRQAEAARREAEERGRMAVEAADIGLWDWDPVARRLQWDERSHALFGLPTGAPVDDQVFLASLHPADRERVQDAIAAALDPEGSGDYDIDYRALGHDGVERWISARGRAVFEGGQAVRFLGAMSDITQSKRIEAENARLYAEAQREIAERTRAQEHLQLLIHELNHRVKNTLATVQSIAVQSLRRAASPEAARQMFTQRLIALSKAHDVLTAENWEGADLHDVVLGAVEPFRSVAQHRFLVSGPPVRLTPKAALALAMAFHELGTNAAKYGALSEDGGHVDIVWAREAGDSGTLLRLVWRETGGPPVKPPSARGFGSRLIERGLAGELNGEAFIRYAPDGVVCTIVAPLTAA